jgi:hypothetical protein
MIAWFPQRLALPVLWLLALLVAIATLAVGALTAGGSASSAQGNPLVYANGEPVPDGQWSLLCIDGVSYVEIQSPRGRVVLPKVRRNGLPDPCTAPPSGG